MNIQSNDVKALLNHFRETEAGRSELNQWFRHNKYVCMPDDYSLQEVVDEVLATEAENVIFTSKGSATLCLNVSELLILYAKAV